MKKDATRTRKKQRRGDPLRLRADMVELAVFEPGESGERPLGDLVAEEAADLVRAGFLDDPAIVREVVASLQGLGTPAMIRKLAGPEVRNARVALAESAKRWPKVTDCDKLDRVLADLDRAGYVTRQNFGCCDTCASLAISDVMKRKARKREVRGYIFFDEQATIAAVQGFGLRLAVGSRVAGDDARVVQDVKRAFAKRGLRTTWSKAWGMLKVHLRWKRRPGAPAAQRGPRCD